MKIKEGQMSKSEKIEYVEDLFDAYQCALERQGETKGTDDEEFWRATTRAALQSWRDARR